MTFRSIALVALLSVSPVVAAHGQSAGEAGGWFSSRGAKFEVTSAVAFKDQSSLDGQTPVILVAVSNTRMNVTALADFVDRKRAIEQLFKDDETPVVYLEFAPDAKWRGISYYLASGNGCAFCTSEVTSTVKLAAGRLAGSVKGAENDRPFDITIDVALLTDDHGAALPAGGGAPGQAYLAYHAALVKQDASALKGTLSASSRETFARAEKLNDLSGFVSYLADKHPMKTVRITGGWATTDKASLLIEGESAIARVIGEVLLVKSGDAWGVDEELTEIVIGQ